MHVSVTYIHIWMNVLSNDAKCVPAEGHDQKNISVFLLSEAHHGKRKNTKQCEDLLCTKMLIPSPST